MAATVGDRIDPVVVQLQREVAALKMRVGAIERDQAVLLRRCGLRDAADERLILAVARAFGASAFRAKQCVHLGRLDPDLGSALAGADCDTAQSLGQLLRRLRGTDVSGLRVECVRESSKGHLWRLSVSSV